MPKCARSSGVLYLNDGDWVESCTALVEHHDGRLELIDWAALNRLSFFDAARQPGCRNLPDSLSPRRNSPASTDMLPPAASHRILIVTDAWKPQVNGVVRTLTTVAEELRAMGHAVEVIGPDRFRTVPCPTYPDIALSLLPRRRLMRLIEAFKPGRAAHRHRGSARPGGAALGETHRLRLHHRVPHPLRRIRQGAHRHPGAADLCLDAALPRRRPGHHGRDAVAARRTGTPRLPQHPRLVPRRRPGAVQAVCRARNGICRGRSSSISAVSRWRRTSAPSSTSICPGPRSWSAAARSLRR